MDSKLQFEAMFNYATIGMVVTDEKGVIINYNRYAENQFGYSKDEIVDKPVDVLLPEQYHHAHVHHRQMFYKHPAPRRMGEGRDLYARKKDGTNFPVEISLSYYELEGKMYVIAFVIDITVRKKNEELVLQQKQELERVSANIKQLNTELEIKVEDRTKMLRETLSALEASKEELSSALQTEKELGELKSRFVTMASHEFRTPLSTILSSAYLLEKYNDASQQDKREKHIYRIKGAVNDMKSILEDFLSLGKLEEGKILAKPELITAHDLFEEMSETVHAMEQVLKNGQQLSFEHNETFFSVFIDKQLLKNVISNLVSNAIKFSPENSKIEVSCNVQSDHLQISVKDDGIGINEEDQQHLFERFFRAKNAANIQGTGLGLHIVSKYLELMNGTIGIESKLNEGSVFSVYIPQENINK